MNILKNKWIHFILLVFMVFLIINSQENGKKTISYLKNTGQIKEDISYTFSKTVEIIAVSKMTSNEIEAYYNQKKERQNLNDLDNINKPKSNPSKKLQQNLQNFDTVYSNLIKSKKSEKSENTKKNTEYNFDELRDEEKIQHKNYVKQKYGELTEVKNRMSECGDYVHLEYKLYEDGDEMFKNNLNLNLLIGSDTIPEMEEIVKGMYLGQKKNVDIAVRENYNKFGRPLPNKKITQELHLLSIEEVSDKSSLNCQK